MGTAIKHPVPDRVKLSFVIFDTRAPWRSAVNACEQSVHFDIMHTHTLPNLAYLNVGHANKVTFFLNTEAILKVFLTVCLGDSSIKCRRICWEITKLQTKL